MNNRIIEFRGRSLKTMEFIYGDLTTSPNGLVPYIIQKVLAPQNRFFMDNLEPEKVDSDTVGQFTGLDCKGQKIWEGDRFTFKYLVELHKAIKLTGTFSFNDAELRYEIDVEPNKYGYVCLSYIGNGQMYDFKVIGNIMENKELPNDSK
jgi:hypothetical protein